VSVDLRPWNSCFI